MQLESILSASVLLLLGGAAFNLVLSRISEVKSDVGVVKQELETFKDAMPERYTNHREFLSWVGEFRESIKRVHERIDERKP